MSVTRAPARRVGSPPGGVRLTSPATRAPIDCERARPFAVVEVVR